MFCILFHTWRRGQCRSMLERSVSAMFSRKWYLGQTWIQKRRFGPAAWDKDVAFEMNGSWGRMEMFFQAIPSYSFYIMWLGCMSYVTDVMELWISLLRTISIVSDAYTCRVTTSQTMETMKWANIHANICEVRAGKRQYKISKKDKVAREGMEPLYRAHKIVGY